MQFHTISEVAKRLQITERAVNKLLTSGQLAFTDVCSSPSGKKPRKRISEDDLQAFLDSRHTESRREKNLRHRRRRERKGAIYE